MPKPLSCRAASVLLLLAAAGCAGTTPTPERTPQDEERSAIDRVFEPWDRPDSPGCAIAVVRGGEIVHARGFGLADLEHGVAIDADTVFDIASTSKQFTAACLVLLEQADVLAIDDDVRRWLPELPDYGAPITIRHLLTHTSGLRDYTTLHALQGRTGPDLVTASQSLALLARQRALNFPTGARYEYSNSGYFLAGVIVERAAGVPLARYAEEQLFAPLGMSSTHFHDDHGRVVPHRACGYSEDGAGGWAIDLSDWEQVGDGALLTSVRDLARWDANLYEPRVGGRALVERLLERGRLADGSEIDYALGLRVDTWRGLRRVSHGGSWAGYRAQLMRFPDQRTSVICLSNLSSFDPTSRCEEVAEIVLAGELGPAPAAERRSREPRDDAAAEEAPAPPSDPEAFAGGYWSDELAVAYPVVARGGRLYTGDFGEETLELVPRGADRFTVAGLEVAFQRDAAGRVSGLVLDAGRVKGLRFVRFR